MRQIYTLLGAILLCFAQTSFGQTEDVGGPISFNGKIKDVSTFTSMPSFDVDALLAEDAINNAEKIGPWRFGYKHDVDLGLNNSGEWVTLPNGDRIWRIGIVSHDAISMNLIFDDYFLPDGATVHLYDADKTQYIGAYTSRNNLPDNMLGTELILSDAIVVEYYEPAEVAGLGRLNIHEVVHGYKSLAAYAEMLARGFDDSGDCNIDVNCPLGNGWEDQIRSVAMIVVNGNGACTGALINNTCNDGTPYFLTADHCLGGASAPGTMSTWAFRFNWESPPGTESCATTAQSTDPGSPYDQTMNGASLLAQNGNSDFALLEITNMTLTDAQNWNAFYAGWDNSDANTVTEATGIHHPSGDLKKICQYAGNAQQTNWGGALCWGIPDWTEGVTEPGSSGSPLFDQNGRIIGQLYGGSAACSGTNDNGAPDYYGRFGVSWDAVNGSANQLAPWLDACGTGATTDDGYDPNAPTVADNAGITGIVEPSGVMCSGTFTPEVTLRNYGTNTLTSVDITYDIDGANQQTFNWTGSLAPSSNTTVILNSMTTTDGQHTFNAATSNPNGTTDNDPSNDAASNTFLVGASGDVVDFSITVDCWGSEVSWTLEDGSGNVWYQGGGYPDAQPNGGGTFTEQWCLATGCYDFVITDSYGDGMYGSQYGSCSVDGTYSIDDSQGNNLATILAANSDYGNSETNNFCVSPSTLTSDFTASSTSVCEGGSIDFTDLSSQGGSPITTWSWSFNGATPNSSTSQNPSGIVYNTPGVYDVTLTVGDGSTTDTKTVTGYITVNDNPTVTVSGTDVTCNGAGDGAAMATPSGGLSPYDYSWSPSGGTTASASGLSGGSYTVLVTDANGCQGTGSVTINEPTAVVISSTNETQASCGASDGSVTVTASGGTGSLEYSIDGTTYQANNTITGLAAGTYDVYVQDANGCQDIVSITISNPNAPVVTSNVTDETCSGDCDGEATANVTGGTSPYTYSWTSGGSAATETGLCAGSYDVTVTDNASCVTVLTVSVASTGTTPTANATPSATTVYLGQQSGNVSFTNSSTNGTSYSWDFGDGNTSTQQNPTHTYTAPGTYTVTLTVTNGGCTDTWTTTIIVVDDTSVEENELMSSVKVYPNPNNGQFAVSIDGLESEDLWIEVLDIRGKLIQNENYINANGNVVHRFDLEDEADGVYFIRVIKEDATASFRLIKR